MPLTQAELKERIATDLLKKYVASLTISQVRDTLTNFSPTERQDLVNYIMQGAERALGKFLIGKVVAHLKIIATTEADAMVTDNTLTAAELNRWLGDG